MIVITMILVLASPAESAEIFFKVNDLASIKHGRCTKGVGGGLGYADIRGVHALMQLPQVDCEIDFTVFERQDWTIDKLYPFSCTDHHGIAADLYCDNDNYLWIRLPETFIP